jgi:asparagine synthase (glutamine-hydrolysing)
MAATMAHRGPDGKGSWRDGEAGLSFRRLAIIDLDPRSNQPLHLGPLHLVFNGEIYNYLELRAELAALGHAFQTEGDSEVLLHAWAEWGRRALDRLNGMFAFGIWDDVRRRLVLAVDPFAEKPLFFHSNPERIVFSSDVRALFVADRRLAAPDEGALTAYIASGSMPFLPKTFFAGIRRLPPGHLAVWEKQALTVQRYWNPAHVEVPASLDAAAERLRELLIDSIRLRLRSDVLIGTSLSGGIDSSAVLGLSANASEGCRHHAFTATFPGFAQDEWGYATEAAQMAGVLEHHPIRPRTEDFRRDVVRVVTDQEEPFPSTSIYAQWCVMKKARETGVTVLLDGQGADELFAGYRGMDAWYLRSLGPHAMFSGAARDAQLIRRLIATYYPHLIPEPLQRWRTERNASPYVSSDLVRTSIGVEQPPPDWEDRGSPLRRELLHQAFRTVLPDICRFADKNSMAHSVEVRLPFLDRRIADFAFSLRPGFLISDGISKRVLRTAAKGYAPRSVLNRRDKVAYATPEENWLTDPHVRRWIMGILSDPSVSGSGRYALDEIARDNRAGQWRSIRAIWRAVNAELWLATTTERAALEQP